MAPAPSPSGTANAHKSHRLPEMEKPSNATAVNAVLKAETLFVPKRLIISALNILETIVPQEIMTVTKLAKDMGRSNSV